MPTQRYEAALHAMQSGVKMEMNINVRPTDPKHLRVGVNSALVNDQAVATLLMAKGIFTEAEYREAVTVAMEQEAARYEKLLSDHYGSNITLA